MTIDIDLRYERELERAAATLQAALDIGSVKHIGLLEVAAGVEQLAAELTRLRTLEAAAIAVVRTRQEVATETDEKLRQSR